MSDGRWKRCFAELHEMADVSGVALFSPEGAAVYLALSDFTPPPDTLAEGLRPVLEELTGMVDAELVFEHGRIYLRRTEAGTLVVFLDPFASVPLVRLQCDVLAPRLKANGSRRRGLWGRRRL